MPPRFVVIVPVKVGASSKTRLGARPSTAAHRQALMSAFAKDAITAAKESAHIAGVVVVSTQPVELGQSLWVRDQGDGDLNQALTRAAQRIQKAQPHLGVMALVGDLPCLDPADIDEVCAFGVFHSRWYVGDHTGSGTTILGAAAGIELDPRFGPNSAQKHLDSGATACPVPVTGARHDVDTPGDLAVARALGVGPFTQEALAAEQGID